MNKVTKNLIYNFTGNIGSKVVSFLVVAITTRMFGSAVFGEFNIASAEYSYFYLFSVMGMNGYGLYLFAKETDFNRRKELFADISSVKTATGFFFAALLLAYAFILPNSHRYVAPYALLLIFQATDLSWALQALQDMKLTAYGSFITIGVNICMLLICCCFEINSVYALITANIISQLALQIIFARRLRKKHGFFLAVRKVSYFKYVKRALPYMVSGLFAGINTNIDMVIMGYMISPQEVGYYSAAFKIISEFIVLCAVVFTPFFPVFVQKVSSGDVAYMNRTTGFLRTIFVCLVLPCAMICFFYGKELLGLVFGKEYEPGYSAFALLMVFVVLLFCREIYGYTLTAAGRQSQYMVVVSISAVFNIVTNMLLIPRYGIVAAAGTTLASELINLVGMRYLVNTKLGIRPENNNISKLFIPLALFVSMLMVFHKLNVMYFVAIVISCCTYAVACLTFGVIRIDVIRNMIKR